MQHSGLILRDKNASFLLVPMPDHIFDRNVLIHMFSALHMLCSVVCRKKQGLRMNASKETPGLMQGIRKDEYKTAEQTEGYDSFNEMKRRFLTFKETKYS